MAQGPNVEAALAFVRGSGKPGDLALLKVVHGEALDDDEVAALTANQNPDGGFKVAELGPLSVVGRTAEMAIYLTALGGGDLGAVQAAADFLIEHQKPDGSWGESPALAASNPPPHFKPDSLDSHGWETAASVIALSGLGLPLDYKPPLEFLRSSRLDVRGSRNFRLEGLLLFALFRRFEGDDARTTVKLRGEVEATPAAQLELFELNWAIYSLVLCGMDTRDPHMGAFGDALTLKQRAEGGWGSGPQPNGYETGLALGALGLAGIIPHTRGLGTGGHEPDPANSDHGI